MTDTVPADEYTGSQTYEDGTLVRISVRRTRDEAYPSGWRYTLHYGALKPGPRTLEDGTIRRYDNAHELTKGHECHVAPDPEPRTVEFPGMLTLYDRFWREIPKQRFGSLTEATDG
ncbi:DUF6516 family protein [Halobaculum sp. MBLA0147]|uniref:toxin-antitoxin system TumE family protein n=1 Tax=Halobaculum sp. MBLA0147 TaxID=3079934 RepID=UPI003524135C